MKVKLLNANLWLLPPPASLENNRRLEKFIAYAKKVDADIINLQEVWLNEYVKKIKKSLKGYKVISPRSMIFNRSGLVSLVKIKPKSWKYHAYRDMPGMGLLEKFADKGYLKIEIQIDGQELSVINTHVYQSEDDNKLSLKIKQLKSVAAATKKHNPTILSGDFNMRPKEISKLVKKFVGSRDKHKTYVEKNKYAHTAVNQYMNWNGVYNEYPDYVFLNSRKKTAKVKSEVVKEPLFSDHYAILSEITF